MSFVSRIQDATFPRHQFPLIEEEMSRRKISCSEAAKVLSEIAGSSQVEALELMTSNLRDLHNNYVLFEVFAQSWHGSVSEALLKVAPNHVGSHYEVTDDFAKHISDINASASQLAMLRARAPFGFKCRGVAKILDQFSASSQVTAVEIMSPYVIDKDNYELVVENISGSNQEPVKRALLGTAKRSKRAAREEKAGSGNDSGGDDHHNDVHHHDRDHHDDHHKKVSDEIDADFAKIDCDMDEIDADIDHIGADIDQIGIRVDMAGHGHDQGDGFAISTSTSHSHHSQTGTTESYSQTVTYSSSTQSGYTVASNTGGFKGANVHGNDLDAPLLSSSDVVLDDMNAHVHDMHAPAHDMHAPVHGMHALVGGMNDLVDDMNAHVGDLDPNECQEAYEGVVAPPEEIGVMAGDIAPPMIVEGSLNYIEAPIREQKEYQLSNEQAKDALRSYADSQFCWGTSAADKVLIQNVQASSRYLYVMESFTEQRTVVWTSSPFRGGHIDGPENGPAPCAWEIAVEQPDAFVSKTQRILVPHTSTVSGCKRCHSRGFVRCTECRGHGRTQCGTCAGTGYRTIAGDRDACTWCAKTGKINCKKCSGKGQISCVGCHGEGKVKWFQELTITWRVHATHATVQKDPAGGRSGGSHDLPENKITSAASEQVISVTGQRVAPLGKSLDPRLQEASSTAINEHNSFWPLEQTLQQRQYVGIVPVFEVKCSSDGGNLYWVYGLDNRVHAPNYPQKYCWCCSVM